MFLTNYTYCSIINIALVLNLCTWGTGEQGENMKKCCICGKTIIDEDAGALYAAGTDMYKDVCAECVAQLKAIADFETGRGAGNAARYFCRYVDSIEDLSVKNYVRNRIYRASGGNSTRKCGSDFPGPAERRKTGCGFESGFQFVAFVILAGLWLAGLVFAAASADGAPAGIWEPLLFTLLMLTAFLLGNLEE